MARDPAGQADEAVVLEHDPPKSQELATRAPAPAEALTVPRDGPVSPASILLLLDKAMERGVPVEALGTLQTILERVSDRSAAREFADALSRFQDACPAIVKNAKASFPTRSGGKMEYRYAELDHIARVIRKPLRDVGLSYSWDSAMSSPALMVVRCTLRHVNGHSESSTFPVPTESNSAASAQQKFGAALTYARRQSLVQVLGLTTTETDDDAGNEEPISAEEAQDLVALIEEVKDPKKPFPIARFLKALEVEKLEELPKSRMAEAVKALREYGERRVEREKQEAEKAAAEKGGDQ